MGAVHRTHKDDNLPYSIRHYWPEYDPEISGAEPRPKSLLQYLAAGRRLAELSGETSDLVEKLAQGLLRLARLMSPKTAIGTRKRNHRYVMERLEGKGPVLAKAPHVSNFGGVGDRTDDHAAGLVSISQMIARTAAKAGKPKANHQRYSR